MFTRLARIFHLTSGTNDENETSSEEDLEGTCVDMGSAYVRPSRKTQEIEGVVTNMYSTYGLINGEIVFTRENFAGSGLPLVGDKVNVKAYKEHASAGWLAERVSKVANCWDDSSTEWTSDEEAKNIINVDCKKLEEEAMKKKRKEKIMADRQALEQLLKEKFGIEIVGTDFGSMEVGDKKSISFEIKNNGTECQSLCSYNMNNKSHQIDFGPLKMIGIDTKSESKKYLEMFPIDIMPGQSVSISVICLAKYIGKESQTIIFYFEKFKLGKVVSVNVSDPSLKFEGIAPDSTYQKVDKLERILMTRQQAINRDSVLVPGPKLQFNKGKQKPKGAIVRLAHYHVPDDLRDCVLNGKDVTRILPCLKWQLNSSNYEIRFSGLLHLEEVQQEIDIREFDMDKASMERAGDYLSLKVPGLLEGRPSLILGDRVIASEVELLNTAAPAYEGVIHQVRNDSVYMMFSPEFHKTFEPETQYNMTFTFNRSTLRRCHMAVELASKFKDEILFPAKIVLKPSQVDLLNCSSASTSSSTNRRAEVVPVTSSIGRKHSSYYPNIQTDQSVKFFNNQLNTRQRLAVIRILQGHARPTPYIIFGPPGTGKTITVVESILQVQHHLVHARILACTPSNSAADLLAERLFQSGVVHKSMMVRLYAALRQDVSIPDSIKSFSSFVDDADLNLEDKSIVICTCATAGCLYRVGKKFSGKSSRNKTDVGRSGNKSDGVSDAGVSFTHVFIDEAGQATEPESMIAVGLVMSLHGQIVLAGDPQQLGPVLRSQFAKDYGLNVSYMERLSALPLYERNENKFSNRGGYDPLLITKLLDNYRSHPSLMYLSSHMFYHGELVMKADKQLMTCLCNWSMLPNKNNFPILFHGVRGEDLREGNSPSWFNPYEVALTVKYLGSLLNNDAYTISPDDVGVITPYKKQVEKIRQTAIRHDLPKVKVGSVEEFQGQERLAIIISTVRSSESLLDLDLKYTLGFLGNQKRFNVAITRAHSLLVVIGNPHVLCQDLCWSRLIRYCINNDAYVGCDLPQFSHDDDPFFMKPDAPHTVPHLFSPDVSVADLVADVAARRVDKDVVADGSTAGTGQVVVADGNQVLKEATVNVKLEGSEELFSDIKIIQEIIGHEEMDDEGSSVSYKNTCIKTSVYDKAVDDFKENSPAVTKPKTLLHSSPFDFSGAAADLEDNDDNKNDDDNKVGGDGGNEEPQDGAASTSLEDIETMRTLTTSGSTISELSNVSVQDLLNKGMIDSCNESMELNEELCGKIQKQIDYYFSDVNLKKDDFLKNQVALNPDGWVSLSVLLTFNRMKTFNVNSRFVAHALRRYSTIVEVDETGEMVRRNPRHVIEPDAEKWKQLLFCRSIVLLNYPHSEKIDDMQTYFEKFGPITHIERGIPVKFFTGPKKRYSLKKADLIIFDGNESARNLFKRSLTQFKSMGLKVYYLDDAVKGCIDYFECCRVNKQSRQSIEYVSVDQGLTSETRLQSYVLAQDRAFGSTKTNLYSPHLHKRYQQGYSHSSKTFNNHRPMLGQRSVESRISSEFEAQFPHEHNRGNDNSRFVSGVGCSTSQRTSSLMAYSPSDLNEAVQNISAMNISSINVSAGKTPTNYFPSSSDDFVGASVMNVGGIDCGDDGDDEDERNELFLPSSCGDVGMKSFDSHVDQIVNDKQADSNDDDEDDNDDDVILISETCVDEDEDSDDGNHNGDDVINKNDVDDKDDDQPVGDGEDFNDVHFENWT